MGKERCQNRDRNNSSQITFRFRSSLTLLYTESKLASIYYSPKGYWSGKAAIKKLASAAKVSEAVSRDWLKRQTIWQIYLPLPRYILLAKFDENCPSAVQ